MICGNVFSQNHQNINLVSTKEVLKKTNQWLTLKDFDSVQTYNEILLKKAKLEQNAYYIGQHYYIKSYYFDLATTQVDSTYFYALKAKETFLKIKDSLQISRVSLFIAELENEEGSYHSSNSEALDAIKYLNKRSNKRLEAITYDIISDNYQHLKLYHDAIVYQQKAIHLKTKDSLFYRNNLASVFNQQNNYTKAVELLDKINIQNINAPLDKAMIIDNLAFYQWKLDTTQKIEPQLIEALKIRETQKDFSGLIESYGSLAEYYSQKQSNKAVKYARKIIATSKKIKQPESELKGLKLLMTLDTKDLLSRDRYIILKDSLAQIRLQTRNQYAKIKYDNTKALQENELLKQQNKRQQLLKKLYGVLALLILISLIFFLNYSLQKRNFLKQKHEKEKLQEVFKTENTISKKIHDEIANGIHQVMSSLERDLEIDSSKLKKLYSLYDRTRDISQEISEINLEESYTDELKGLCSNYHNIYTRIIIKGIDEVEWHTIDSIKKETLYRVLNELMTNMKKHSKAQLVVIIFEGLKNTLNVSYKDNGIGFEKNTFFRGSGFKNMENRILSLQGYFTFESSTNNGLKIQISFPI